ncbi:DUF5107 domain-containing protein [Kitasatospora cinereorecta]|uniref:DUF5107 domain-containing protein n=1 Tax=Kitasatospora cinereorecta TaxID=285560 RepID=A0ABW0VMB5_9ACTN
MTSTLRTATVRLPAAALPTAGPLPILHGTGVPGEGQPATLLPYTAQGRYDRVRTDRELPAVVLENGQLTAVFLPTLGGRLQSLRHRPTGRELLHRNPVFQPADLALRGAWFAGGVEWNAAGTGHHPLTCAPLHTVRTERADGTPVLRMYEVERMRRLVFRLDAWLPPGSALLHVQVALHNPGEETVPAYWWSNTAVPETPGTRVFAPASEAFHYDYSARLRRVPFPVVDGTDRSRPAGVPYAADYFLDLPAGTERPWIAALADDGTGLVQFSTARLRGRKVFHWGGGTGGRRWQEWLSGPDARYLEIQAGLAATQLEHLPLPGRTTWSWTEAYGPLTDRAAVDGAWSEAVARIDRTVRELPFDPAPTPDDRPMEPLFEASGWGALEQRAGALPQLPGLPFPAPGEEQRPWLELLETGKLPISDPPAAPVTGAHWAERLAGAEDWHALLQLGLLHLADGRPADARAAWQRSLAAERTPWALRNLAALKRLAGRTADAADLLAEAHTLLPALPELTVETLDALLAADRPADALALVDRLPGAQRAAGRIRLLEARAALAAGLLGRAERLLADGIEPADLREGEDALDTLWYAVHEARLAAGGPVTDAVRERVGAEWPLPRRYDFRMRPDDGR